MDEVPPPRPRRAGPDGVPIGRALALPPRIFHEDLYRAVRSIDTVHGDGRLPTIPVLPRTGLAALGRFVVRDGAPSEILIRSDIAHRGFTPLHEVGHFLDFAGLGEPDGFASVNAEADPAAWRRAYERSRGYGDLAAAAAELVPTLPPEAETSRLRLLQPLAPEEVWARSYAQYVTARSGDPALLAGLEAFRTEQLGTVYYPMHREDDDFRPIGAAIEAMFRRLGW